VKTLSDLIAQLPPQQQQLARDMAVRLLAAGADQIDAFFASMYAGNYLAAFRLCYNVTPGDKRRQRSAELKSIGVSLNTSTAAAARSRDEFVRAVAAFAWQIAAAKAGL